MEKANDKQRKALGRGLSALLPARPAASAAAEPSPEPRPTQKNTVTVLATDLVDPNPLQPRTIFDSAKLEELAASIRANGIIQPLIVRHKGDRYELVAGERRLRAAKLAELAEVPAVVQDYADDRLLEVALVENIQREDLNPIETAQALDRLAREMNLSHEEIGRRTGKDRTTVTNLLRLLKLPEPIQLLVAEHRISMGHARAILGLTTPDHQVQLAEKTAAQGYSVRQVERLVNEANNPRAAKAAEEHLQETQDPNVLAAIHELESALGTRIRILERTPERGAIVIEYYSQDDLSRIYEHIVGNGKREA